MEKDRMASMPKNTYQLISNLIKFINQQDQEQAQLINVKKGEN